MQRFQRLTGEANENIDAAEFSNDWFRRHLGVREYYGFAAEDHPKFPITDFFDDAFKVIEAARQRKEAVLVHCMQGLNRSATLVAGWLAKYANMEIEEAVLHIASRRADVFSNTGFLTQLLRKFPAQHMIHDSSPQRTKQTRKNVSNFVKDIHERNDDGE
jgi:protein-tyrosine phosphatase